VSDQLKVLPQYLLPKKALTALMGKLAGTRGGSTTTTAIKWFIGRYGVQMQEAANPDPASYSTFNEFFTRPLKVGVRPIADSDFVCPVDGAISQFGAIDGDQIFQAKGHSYSTRALVGGDEALAKSFDGGQFATIYLSPKDYHRIHMPQAGVLKRMIYVPGDLFSVNPTTARGVPGLFARNERVVCVFESEVNGQRFPFVNVLVGATVVGSMATVWHGVVNPPRLPDVHEWIYESDKAVLLAKAAEMGRFLLGSTVVMLYPKDTIRFNESWAPMKPVHMGEAMGSGTHV
jgi:phosphatidylserine decarboxylase